MSDHQHDSHDNTLHLLDKLTVDQPSAEAHASSQLRRFQATRSADAIRSNSAMNKNLKPILAGIVGILLAFAVFSMPAARAIASDVLGIFRVQKFAPISVSPEQMQVLEEVMSGEDLYPGELVFDENYEPAQSFDSVSAAAASANSYLYTIDALGTPDHIEVQSGTTATLTVNLEGARGLLDAVGADPTALPDSLDGQNIVGSVNYMAMQGWDEAGIAFVQTDSPYFDYPIGVNPQPIGAALLQVLGMDEAEAERLSRNIDWTNTLLMPIPAEFASFSEVPINDGSGTTGLAIEPIDGTGSVIMWQSGGRVYTITGMDADTDTLLGYIDSLNVTFSE